MKDKIEKLLTRLVEIEQELGNPATVQDQDKYKGLTREHSYLSELKEAYSELVLAETSLAENQKLAQTETDPEFLKMIKEEIALLDAKIPLLDSKVHDLLVPPDPNDDANVIVELRAGTGGDEAALFVGDCVRMYSLFAERMKWKTERLSAAPSEMGGFKEFIMVISGKGVHRRMQYEAGTHRVQRVPETETQGRVHTSAVTIAVLMEPGEEAECFIDEKDLKIDTYRASGAGGQHVNTTDSAVRITHLPTGTVVYCQEERSQHKNKAKAMRLLGAKIAETERRKKEEARAGMRSQQIGSGDRSERIRTYNFPQNRVTDHRIDLTLYKLDRFLEGDLEEMTGALVSYFYQEKLKNAHSG
ncbi:MAG: peptide chain release factor 1 [Simkaniaceae bacterium]|nr:peptide chain release factor 1 [Simkaniaceae bacterium]